MKSVELACSHQFGDTTYLMLVADRLALANYGAEGYASAVDPGYASVTLIGSGGEELRSVRLQAQLFSKGTTADIKGEPASMIYVKAGAIRDVEVEYYFRNDVSTSGAVSRSNFLPFSEFKKILLEGVDGNEVAWIIVELEPSAYGRNWGEMETQCRFPVDEIMHKNASDPAVGAFPRDCFHHQNG